MSIKHKAFSFVFPKIVSEIVIPVKAGDPTALTNNKLDAKNAVKFKALWDTGANLGAISQKVVDILGLRPTGSVSIAGVHGIKIVNTYTINIYLYPLATKLCFENIEVAGSLCGEEDILIGMDIIQHGDFQISNSKGKTTVSFYYPPLENIISLVEQCAGANDLLKEHTFGRVP
jgi:hypothetical protein